jgi:hypothetical protein
MSARIARCWFIAPDARVDAFAVRALTNVRGAAPASYGLFVHFPLDWVSLFWAGEVSPLLAGHKGRPRSLI